MVGKETVAVLHVDTSEMVNTPEKFADMIALYHGIESASQYATLIGRGLWEKKQKEDGMKETPIHNELIEKFDRAMGDLNEAIKNFNSTMYPIMADLLEFQAKCEQELKDNGRLEGPGDGAEGGPYVDLEGTDLDTQGQGDQDSLWDDIALQTEGKESGDNTE